MGEVANVNDKLFVGVDVGIDGGVAWVDDGDSAAVVTMPVVPTGKGTRRGYDTAAIHRMLDGWRGLVGLVVLERQQAFPQQGSVSNFTTGMGFGVWLMALTAHDLPYEVVQPKAWQKTFGISGGDTKAQAAVVALRLWPNQDFRATPRCRKVHDGMVDAYLMAEFAKRRVTTGHQVVET